MLFSEISAVRIRNTLDILKVIGGVVLLLAVSWEIIGGYYHRFSDRYLTVQLVVCLLFLCDFFVNWGCSKDRKHYFIVHLPALLISIPYLNIILWTGFEPSRYVGMLIGTIPLLRAFLAFFVVVTWFVNRRAERLLLRYIITLIVFTYLAALVFYDYELPVNDKLHGFGNALWWAWMNVTTVGAEIFPVTAIGKILAVLLPLLGMMMLPIITTFIQQEYPPKGKKKSGE